MGGEPSTNRIGSSLRRILTPSGAVAVTVMLSIPVKELRERLVDPDLWWHLRTGRLIAETGSIPNADVYSFTAAGSPWVVQEWGSELLLHLIREWFGLGGIVAYKAVLLFAIYAIFARLVVRRMGTGMGAWALIGISAYAGAPNWTERPNLLSFFLFVVTLALLERRDSRIWWFVPVAAVWANLHGMVLLGIGLVVVYAAGAWATVRLQGGDRSHARRLSVVALAGLAATLVNPAGPKLLAHSLSLVRSVRGIVTEWASPDFHEPGPALFLVLLLVVIAALALQPGKVDITDLLLVVSFTFLAMQAVRNLLVSSIILGSVGASAIPAALGSIRTRKEAAAPKAPSQLIPGIAIACVIGLFAFLVVDGAAKGGGGDAYIHETYPVAAIDALDRPGVRVFVFDVWSGMVIDRAWPNARVFADLRTDLYGREHMRRYQRTIAARPGWDTTLNTACVTNVLIQPEDPLSQVLTLSAGWRIERQDEVSVTFARTQSPPGC